MARDYFIQISFDDTETNVETLSYEKKYVKLYFPSVVICSSYATTRIDKIVIFPLLLALILTILTYYCESREFCEMVFTRSDEE